MSKQHWLVAWVFLIGLFCAGLRAQPVSPALQLERKAREKAEQALELLNQGKILSASELIEDAPQLIEEPPLLKENLAWVWALRGHIAARLFLASPQALADVQNAVQLDPRNGVFRVWLAEIYFASYKGKLAQAEDEQALQLLASPTSAQDYYARGLIFLRQDEADKAEKEFTKAYNLTPPSGAKFVDALRMRGVARAAKGDLSKALKDFEQALTLNPQFFEVYLSHAEICNKYKSANCTDQVEALANKALEGFKDYAAAYRALAAAKQKKDDFDGTIAAYTSLVKINPKNVVAYYERGGVYKRNGVPALAIADFSKTIELDPGDYDNYYRRAQIYKESGETDKALADYSKALELNQDSLQIHLARADLYVQQEKFDLALADYGEVLRIDPNDFSTYFERADVYKIVGNTPAAEKTLNTLASLATTASQAVEIGTRLATRDEDTLALSCFDKALQFETNYVEAYLAKGNLYLKQEKSDRALGEYSQALKIDPKNISAYFKRAAVYKTKGDTQAMERDYTALISALATATAEMAFGAGERFQRAEEYAWAVRCFEKAIESDPNYKEAYKGLGISAFYVKLRDKALNALSYYIETSGQDAAAYLFRGQIYGAFGDTTAVNSEAVKADYIKALADFDAAIEKEPTKSDHHKYRGLALAKLGREDEALTSYTEALRLSDDDSEAFRWRGSSWFAKQEYAKAIEDYSQAIDLEYSSAKLHELYLARGEVYGLVKNYEKALADFNHVLTEDAQNFAALRSRAYFYLQQKDDEKARQDFAKLVTQHPDNEVSYLSRGHYYEEKKNYDKALEDYKKAIELKPELPDGYVAQGFIHYRQYKFDQAVTDLNQALEKDSNNFFGLLLRAVCYSRQKKFALALSEIEKLRQQNSTNGAVYQARGNIYFDLGSYDLAIADFTKVLELTPDSYLDYVNRGECYLQKGNSDQALADLKRAALGLADESLYVVRGLYYLKRGDDAQAIAETKQALERNPSLPDAFWVRGCAHFNQGKRDEALTDFAKALEIYPEFAEVQRDRQLVLNAPGYQPRLTAVRIKHNLPPGTVIKAASVAPPPAKPTPITNSVSVPAQPVVVTTPQAPAPAMPQGVINLGSVQSLALPSPKPVYPELAKQSRVSGEVKVSVEVDETGKVISAKAVSGAALLRGEAERAAFKTKFKPYLVNGTAQRFSGFLIYNFVL